MRIWRGWRGYVCSDFVGGDVLMGVETYGEGYGGEDVGFGGGVWVDGEWEVWV